MGVEIERKYLVSGEAFKSLASACHHIIQGYLCAERGRTVRVRIIDGTRAVITIKGPASGLSRPEFEYDIPVTDAEQMCRLCTGVVIDKHRYIVSDDGNRWEVDVFHGVHEGLVIAELELPSEEYEFRLPTWVGREVTGDRRYYNSVLSDVERD